MTTREERVQLALHRLAESQADIAEAVTAHHKAMVAAVRAGCTQSQMSAALGVTRQAVHQYVKRWLEPPVTRRGPAEPTLWQVRPGRTV